MIISHDLTDYQYIYDPQWKSESVAIKEPNPGYEGLGPNRGKFVGKGEAFTYACEACGITPTEDFDPYFNEIHRRFKDGLVDCFYSGNWLEVNSHGE